MNHEAFIIQELKRTQVERGVKINYLANRVGMTPEMLGRTLLGRRTLKADELVRLCLVLEVPFSRLVPAGMAKRRNEGIRAWDETFRPGMASR